MFQPRFARYKSLPLPLLPLPIFTARKRSLGQGNIFTPVCHSVHGGACVVAPGGACMVARGGMRGCWGGMCGCSGGHVWFYLGACVVLFRGGMHGFIWGACVVLFRGGMRGFFRFFGYNEIRSMSGRYASYWNAFLLPFLSTYLQLFHYSYASNLLKHEPNLF